MVPEPRRLDQLIGGTRHEVLELLLRSDRTVQEIAEEIGVSANAIRGHLAALERDGLVVQARARRDTGGKPATLYTLSQDAVELFPKAYAFVLEGLLEVLDQREGPERVREALAEVGAHAAVRAEGSDEEKVRAAADALRALGATVEIRREEGHWKVQGFSCPLSSVTAHDERACGLATALVRKTTGASVVKACQRGDRPRCAFEISFPER